MCVMCKRAPQTAEKIESNMSLPWAVMLKSYSQFNLLSLLALN